MISFVLISFVVISFVLISFVVISFVLSPSNITYLVSILILDYKYTLFSQYIDTRLQIEYCLVSIQILDYKYTLFSQYIDTRLQIYLVQLVYRYQTTNIHCLVSILILDSKYGDHTKHIITKLITAKLFTTKLIFSKLIREKTYHHKTYQTTKLIKLQNLSKQNLSTAKLIKLQNISNLKLINKIHESKFSNHGYFTTIFKKSANFTKKLGKSSVFQFLSTEMEAHFVLSQKGTNFLKDDENHLYNKYKENRNKT